MKKKCFTVIETLISSSIFGFIAIIGFSLAVLITHTLYTGQIESVNKSSLNEMIYYITREIQSAENIKVSSDKKTIEIKERGNDSYNIKYELKKNYPVDYLSFKGKRLLDVDYEKSSFIKNDEVITIKLYVINNNIDTKKIGRQIEFSIKPRCRMEG